MAFIYNHRSQSISMPMTYAEYAAAHPDGLGTFNGVSLLLTVGERGHYGIYRHEFAHFASYNATGLVEFHSIFFDYRLYLHQRFVSWCLDCGHPPTFPIVHAGSTFEPEVCAAFQAANDQVRAIEGFLFGYGTTKSMDELFDWQVQEAFLTAVGDQIAMAHPNVYRARMVYHQILLTTDPDISRDPQIMHPLVSDPIDADKPPLRLTSRAVLEAYAITIEVVSKYLKAIAVNPIGGMFPAVRLPARIDAVALEACFDLWPERTFTLRDFLAGRAPSEVYWCISLVTYAAMMVPVVADPSGDTCVMGSLNQLSVAARLAQFLNQIAKGTIRHPKETYEPQSRTEGGDRNPGIQRWLIDAMRAIGDPWSFKINKRIANFVMSGEKENPDLVGASRSQHQIAKIARCELFMEPYGFISEGGIWSSAAPNYLITADNQLVVNLPVGTEPAVAFFYYVNDSILEVLEAMADERSWAISWDKLAVNDDQRKDAVAATLFRTFGKDHLPDLSELRLLF